RNAPSTSSQLPRGVCPAITAPGESGTEAITGATAVRGSFQFEWDEWKILVAGYAKRGYRFSFRRIPAVFPPHGRRTDPRSACRRVPPRGARFRAGGGGRGRGLRGEPRDRSLGADPGHGAGAAYRDRALSGGRAAGVPARARVLRQGAAA